MRSFRHVGRQKFARVRPSQKILVCPVPRFASSHEFRHSESLSTVSDWPGASAVPRAAGGGPRPRPPRAPPPPCPADVT